MLEQNFNHSHLDWRHLGTPVASYCSVRNIVCAPFHDEP